jgi:hypothetical protein
MAQEHELGGNRRTADEIRKDIASKRESISEAVGQLGEKIQDTFDWRGYVIRHPYAAVGVAAGAGLVVGGLIRRRQTPLERIKDAISDATSDAAREFQKSLGRFAARTGAHARAKNTLSGIVTKAVSNFIHSRFMDGHH